MEIIGYLESDGWEHISGVKDGSYSYSGVDKYSTIFRKGQLELTVGLDGDRGLILKIYQKTHEDAPDTPGYWNFIYSTTEFSPAQIAPIIQAIEDNKLTKVEQIERRSRGWQQIEIEKDVKYIIEDKLHPH